MPGIDVRSASIVVRNEEGVSYADDGSESSIKSGTEITDAIIAAWKKSELISIEDSHVKDDKLSLRDLKEKITQYMNEVKGNKDSTQMSYALSGIGRESGCFVQIIADSACTSPEELTAGLEEAIFNSIKVRLRSYRTVSRAISMCKAARSAGWAVIIGADEDYSETIDSFLSDFAVGVGASQIVLGTLDSSEGCSKMNRLLEIYQESDSISFVGRSFRSV
jgi:Enolase, C-terminal TIM barrel domain